MVTGLSTRADTALKLPVMELLMGSSTTSELMKSAIGSFTKSDAVSPGSKRSVKESVEGMPATSGIGPNGKEEMVQVLEQELLASDVMVCEDDEPWFEFRGQVRRWHETAA